MMNNFELRMRLRRAIKPNFQVLLVIALIVALPELLVSVGTVLTGSDVWTYLYQQGIDTSATADRLLEAVSGYYTAGRGWMVILCTLLQALVTPVLTIGFINAILTLMRGGTATVNTVFSRLSAFVRAMGVALLTLVKTFLWSLPSVPLMALAVYLLFQTQSIGLYLFLMMVALGLMLALMIMATYRYVMALFFLADEPELGPLTCIRQSKAVMKGRKMQLFMLEAPYIIGYMVAGSFISALLSGVIGTALSMMVQLIFMVYIYSARCVFFEATSRPDGGRAHAFQSDPYHDDEMKDQLN